MTRSASRHRSTSAVDWPGHVRRASGRVPGRKQRSRPSAGELAGQHRRQVHGLWAETAAALLMMLKGYRIVARRVRGRYGEIDLIAVRGRRLAFVEVKYRRSVAGAAAAITDEQIRRITDAAEHWVWRHPRFHEYEIGLDAVLVGRFLWPRHAPNALQPG